LRCKIKLGTFEISQDSPCFIIAEVGHNHQGKMDVAKKMIDAAASNGASAVKLQKRDNKALFTTIMYNKPYDNENSFGLTYGEHRDALEFNKEQYKELKTYTEDKGLVFFATAFDFESVDFLESLKMPAYKIASGDITNHPLLEYIASKKKPVFFSTGACSMEEVREAYDIIRKHTDQICMMQCTADYPSEPKDMHLNVITTFMKEFPDAIIGLSSHDNGIVMPVVAYVLGARVIEKHFTLSRAMKGTDHKFSLEPQGLRKMTRDLSRVRVAYGDSEKKAYPFEIGAKKKMGKSIVPKQLIKKGEVITKDMLGFKSPGDGIPPSKLDQVIGKKAKEDLPEETIITLDHLE